MTDNIKSFTLNNSLAAISATILEDKILATDGINRIIHTVYQDGSVSSCTETARPLRRLRKNGYGSGFTALGRCNDSRLYFIDSDLNEQGYTRLETGTRNCSRCGDLGAVTDAMTVLIGNSCFIVAAFNSKAFLFNSNGSRISLICETNENEYLTDFISFGNERYAMSSVCNGRQTVVVSDNGNVHSANLDRSFSLRMLFCENDVIYGLFGQSYLYNRIIPIYSSGILKLPQTAIENSCFPC